MKVGILQRRPRMPDGLHPEVASIVRRCLHHDPSRRPTAKDLTKELIKCRQQLEASIKSKKNTKITGRDEALRKQEGASAVTEKVQWSIVDTRNPEVKARWSRGQYRLQRLHRRPDETGKPFSLHLRARTQGQWEEDALCGEETEPVESTHESTKASLPVQSLGLVFEDSWPKLARVRRRDELGNSTLAPRFPDFKRGCTLTRINGRVLADCVVIAEIPEEDEVQRLGLVWNWPFVKKIEDGAAVEGIPELEVGCKLLSVNGESVEDSKMDFQTAKEKVQARPLTLVFATVDASALMASKTPPTIPLTLDFTSASEASAVKAWPTSDWAGASKEDLPKWLQAGLKAIKQVQSHETQRRATMAEQLAAAQAVAEELAAAKAEITRLRRNLAQFEAVPPDG